MPFKCTICGKEHRTQEELEAEGKLSDEIQAGEAPEEILERFAPKNSKSK